MLATELPQCLQGAERVVLFDGVCRLCNGWARFLIAHDPECRFKLASVQSAQGQAILRHFELPANHFESMVYIEHGRLFLQSNAVLRITEQLSWPWPLLSCLAGLPRPLRDRCYGSIARNRYRLFGKHDQCMVASAKHAGHFLEEPV